MQLMVSVVRVDEVGDAVAGGADILDIKNPAEGSLGANTPDVIRQIRARAPKAIKVSAAIGDMPNLPGTASLAALGAAYCGVDYVKVGLRGPSTQEEAVFLLQAIRRALLEFPGVSVIAAGYADFARAGTLDPRLLPGIALAAGVQGCLLDTAIKDGRGLFDFLAPGLLCSLADEAHRGGLIFALAGALRAEDLALTREVGADVVGVRTAVCRDRRRSGRLDAGLVRSLRAAITLPMPETAKPDRFQTGP